MSLVTLESIVVNTTTTGSSSIIILYYLLSDSGPNNFTLVNSSLELYCKFYSTEPESVNFRTAVYLLDLGYKLLIKRVSSINNYISLRLYEDGTYSYPDINTEYTYIHSGSNSDLSTYSIKINVNDDIQDGDFFILSNLGYIKNNYYNNLFVLSDESEDNIDISDLGLSYQIVTSGTHVINLSNWKSDLVTELIKLSYEAYWKSDTELIISSYIPFLPIKSSSSRCDGTIVFDSEVSVNTSYDFECSNNSSTKIIDFYSQNPLNQELIYLSIDKYINDLYKINISLIIEDVSYKIESFIVSMDSESDYYIENVLIKSELISFKLLNNTGSLPEGSYELKRVADYTTPTNDDIISIIQEEDKLEPDSFDIILDGYFDLEVQQAIYDKYKDWECLNIFRQLESSIDTSRQSNTIYIYPDIYKYINSKYQIFPGYVPLLELMINHEYSGNISDIISGLVDMELEIDDDTDIHVLDESDGYTYQIPIKFIQNSSGKYVPYESILVLVLLRTKVYYEIDTTQSLSNIKLQVNSLINNISLENSRVSKVTLEDCYIIEKLLHLKIKMSYDEDFIDPITTDISIEI